MSKNYLSCMDYVSDCCGVPPRGNGDCDTSDIGICPECGDHCEYVDYSDDELTDGEKEDWGSTAAEQTDDLGFQEFSKNN